MIDTAAPVYEVTEIRAGGGQLVREFKTCLHANTVPVEALVSDELVARLCVDCDTQLSA